MSYCRFSDDSDVYVFPTTDDHGAEWIVCCACSLRDGEWARLREPSEMITHLERHKEHGDKVPLSALRRLRREMAVPR